MTIPRGDAVLTSAWLSTALERSRAWPHGPVQVLKATRIGVEHGMRGRIHRIVAQTKRGGSRSLAVKQEAAGAVERELLFRSECGEVIQGTIPDCYIGVVDPEAERGVLVLEDISPAAQGHVFLDCTEKRAEAVPPAAAARIECLPQNVAIALDELRKRPASGFRSMRISTTFSGGRMGPPCCSIGATLRSARRSSTLSVF